jgi:hypothetical protein
MLRAISPRTNAYDRPAQRRTTLNIRAMAPKLGVLPLMLLSWPPHRGERTSGAAGHKLAATIEWRAWVPPLSSPVAALLRSRSSPRQGRCMHPPTQGSITAPVSNSQPHADQPERQPERDSGHRARDLELHGWFMLGTGAQEVGLPKFGTHHPPRMPPGNPQMGAGELSADRDT